MAGREPEHRVRVPLMRQVWRNVVFIHWPYRPDAIAEHLPAGFTIDTYDGTAWVALSAFEVAACNLGPLPPLTVWAFPETNLRTYVTGPDDSDGIWFLSIEAQTVPVTLGARLALGAPYHLAAMQLRRHGSEVRYTSRRHRTPGIGHDIRIRITEPLEPAERAGLVDWCTGRWRSWTTRAGLTLRSPVRHQPWPLHHADLAHLDQTITTAAGLPPPDVEPLVHYAPGVDARLALPRPHLRKARAA